MSNFLPRDCHIVHWKWVSSAALAAAWASLAPAVDAATADDFVLKDNGWTYREILINDPTLRDRSFSIAGSADFIDPTGIDHFAQNWWWYRVEADSREYALTNQVLFKQIAENSIGVGFIERAQGLGINDAVRFDFVYTLTADSATKARVDIDIHVKNLTRSNRTVNLFAYFDPDLNGTRNDDSARVASTTTDAESGRIIGIETSVTDPVPGGFAMKIDGEVSRQSRGSVRNFRSEISEGTSLLDRLTNQTLTNLNGNATQATGDIAGAYQWPMSLDAGQTVGLHFSKALAAVPEPSSWLLFGPGLVLLLRLKTSRGRSRAV